MDMHANGLPSVQPQGVASIRFGPEKIKIVQSGKIEMRVPCF